MEENLLFYTLLFISFVRRALRLDLAAPKNALLVARTVKVFSLTNLNDIIVTGMSKRHRCHGFLC